MLAPRDESHVEGARAAAAGFVHWYNAGQKTLAAASAEDVITYGLNMLYALQSEGVTLESTELAEKLRTAATLIDPTRPTVLVELDRGQGFTTTVEKRPDGREDVVEYYRGEELERYTREPRIGR